MTRGARRRGEIPSHFLSDGGADVQIQMRRDFSRPDCTSFVAAMRLF